MSNKLIEFSEDEKRVIKDTYFPVGTSVQEMQFCMAVASNLGLNPILKEIYFVERKAQVNGQWVRKIEPLVGRDAFLKLAHTSGVFKGIETTVDIEEVPEIVNGEWAMKNDLVATCKVYRIDIKMPFEAKVSYSEYVQRKFNGEVTKFWKEKPTTMLKKVAESQALRRAFNVSGVYTREEIGNDDIQEVTAETSTATSGGINQALVGDCTPENSLAAEGGNTEHSGDLLSDITVEVADSELGMLKSEALEMGLKFRSDITANTLRKKIATAKAEEEQAVEMHDEDLKNDEVFEIDYTDEGEEV